MEGDLLLRAETLALIGSILLIGGMILYFGTKAVKSDDSPIREEADVLSCSEMSVELISSQSNGTHFTAYLDSNGEFRLEVFGEGNATVLVNESDTVQKVTVPVRSVSNVSASFPGCSREVDLL